SLYIAAEMKKKLPGITIIGGGPDVAVDSRYMREAEAIDIGVIGNGEVAFCRILEHILEGKKDFQDVRGIFFRQEGRLVTTGGRLDVNDLDEIPSPYLLGYIDPAEYRRCWVTSVRGCRHRCAYCACAGTYRGGRFSVERICGELKYIAENGGSSVGFADASFINSPDFNEICEYLKNFRKIHDTQLIATIYVEHLTAEKADRLKESGFDRIGVGLQSANAAALKAVNRTINLDRFVRGIRYLEERDIEYLVDIIIGLPNDTLEDIRRTVRFLREHKITRFQTFTLQVLPGTELWKKAEGYGIRHRKEPPYEMLEASYLSREEIRKAADLVEEERIPAFPGTFSDHCQSEYPRKRTKNPGRMNEAELFNRVVVSLDEQVQSGENLRAAGEELSRKIRLPFIVHFKCEDAEKNWGLMKAFIGPVAAANPYLVLNVILESGKAFSLSQMEKRWNALSAEKKDIFARTTGRRPAVRLRGLFHWKGGMPGKHAPRNGIPVYWALKVDNGVRWRGEVREALEDTYGQGIVVEVDPGLPLSAVREAVRCLEEEGRTRGKEVHYRNLALAYAVAGAGSGEALNMRCVIESTVEIDRRLTMRRQITPGPETDLELIGWQMKTGISADDIMTPVTHDRPYRSSKR
ncbi:MAG: B12-binding domain-containing radical SAM protein, partial [Endomicrobiales bacterium]